MPQAALALRAAFLVQKRRYFQLTKATPKAEFQVEKATLESAFSFRKATLGAEF